MTFQVGDRVTPSKAEGSLGSILGYIGKHERGTITDRNSHYFRVDWDGEHAIRTGWRPQDLELVSAVDRLARVLAREAS